MTIAPLPLPTPARAPGAPAGQAGRAGQAAQAGQAAGFGALFASLLAQETPDATSGPVATDPSTDLDSVVPAVDLPVTDDAATEDTEDTATDATTTDPADSSGPSGPVDATRLVGVLPIVQPMTQPITQPVVASALAPALAPAAAPGDASTTAATLLPGTATSAGSETALGSVTATSSPPPAPAPPSSMDHAAAAVAPQAPASEPTHPTHQAQPDHPMHLAGLSGHAATSTPAADRPVPSAPDAGGTATSLAPAAGTAPVTASVAPGAAASDAPAVSRQVAAEVLRLAESGPRHDTTRHVTLQLNPAALGEVRVTLSIRGGSVRVRLAAGSGVTREALADGVPELRRLLAEHTARPGRPDSGAILVTVADLPREHAAGAEDPRSAESSLTDGSDPHRSDPGNPGSQHSPEHGGPAFGGAGRDGRRPARTPVGHIATDGSRPAAHLPSVDDQPSSRASGRLDVSV